MILSRRVSFCGEQLDELDESIVIRHADPGVPNESVQTVERMGGWGSRVTGQHWNQLEASVTFAINIKKTEMARRREVFDRVIAWANRKGWLEFSAIEDRRLYVEKTVIPGGGDMREWLNEYTITFRAYSVPFWESKMPATAVIESTSSGTTSIEVGGTAPGTLDVSFRNISGATITNVSIWLNGKEMSLNGVNLTASETLNITHPAESGGLLRIYAGSRNVYALRRGIDDLTVKPGVNSCGVSASRAGKFTVTNYARWL